MLQFKPLSLPEKPQYDKFLKNCHRRGCEYSFANLYLWGRQQAAFYEDSLVFFSQFNRKSVYPFPLFSGDPKPVLDAIMHDAATRGIPCRLTSLSQDDCALLEKLYPGKFRYHDDRDSFDYIYAIDELAQLKGRKFQKKRNHLNKFLQNHPDYTLEPITDENTHAIREFLLSWYATRQLLNPHGDFHMEKIAIDKALRHRQALGIEGLVMTENGRILAMTMGCHLHEDTFDVQFEKAAEDVDGAYNAINWEFARYLQAKYPALKWLDREDDMGIEGLRKAKLSYCPDRLIEKYWACLLEDGYDY